MCSIEPRSKIRLLFGAAYVAGLIAAYIGVAAGVIGWFDARAVSFYALSGGAFAFISAIGYFIMSDHEIRRRFSSVQ